MFERTDITPTIPQVDSNTFQPDWKALFLFNIYRLTVAILFVSVVLAEVSPSFLGQFDRRLFLVVGWLYGCIGIFSFVTIRRRWPPFRVQVVTQVLLDIFAITILMHASGGINSGLGMLLAIVVTGGSLLSEGRTVYFFAAVASLCLLFQVTISDIYYWFPYANYTHAGILGISFFATAFLAHTLAKRVRVNEVLARQRGIHLEFMQQLNAQIVQHIQSGIVVIDILGRIRSSNDAARRLLGLKEQQNGQALNYVSPELAQQVLQWQKSGKDTKSLLFRPATGEVDVIATFMELTRGGAVSILIVLEDATLTTKRAAQLKLASLGRLTASIAHEIRNPLSAINHAAELLVEFPHISPDEARLAEIIVDHAQRVNNIVSNVLHLSRREQADTQYFDLQAWLQSYVSEFIVQQGLDTAEIVLQTSHETLRVCFDVGQLYQVLNNLCENGLRYSHDIPRLELKTGITEESNRPYLEVQDQGPGVTEEVKSQLFEPFFTTESKGSGLGLYLSREICEANQAALHLVSAPNTSCCFRIYFTLAEDISQLESTNEASDSKKEDSLKNA
jgi:two-component system sensor histidine kinase PilS (NtrC family)